MFDSIMTDCGCFHPLYLDIDDDRGGKLPCDMSDSCVDDIMKQFEDNRRSCDCSEACDETQYKATISTSKWPSNQYLVNIFDVKIFLLIHL